MWTSNLTRYHAFLFPLFFTTALSLYLLIGNARNWVLSGKVVGIAQAHRATIQLIIQVISHILGWAQILVICRLINLELRLKFNHAPLTLNALQMWSDLTVPRLNLGLPFKYFVLLLGFAIFSILPSSLWAGSLTPVIATTIYQSSLLIPNYANVSLIKEYPSEIGASGPFVRNRQGLFTYNVGIQLAGQLLSSASAATPPDNSERLHGKLDNSGFTYINRSYGVGASVGLLDQPIITNDLTVSYSYLEDGYVPTVSCIYNQSSNFMLQNTTYQWVYEAYGELPDSDSGPEESSYIGHTMDSIVAIGVAHFAASPGAGGDSGDEQQRAPNLRRYIAFAAGLDYEFLDMVQCTVDFTPTRFNVSVQLGGRNITVTPLSGSYDIDPNRNLTNTLLRQFELLSNDETNLYVSLVGNAFNDSITDFQTAQTALGHAIDANQSTLEGVANSIVAMTDDMLQAYASAQLIVGNKTRQASVQVEVEAVQFGARPFIVALFVFNSCLLLLVAEEAVRTQLWRRVSGFNYADIRHAIVAASTGGSGLIDFVHSEGKSEKTKARGDDIEIMMDKTIVELGRCRGRPALILGKSD